MSKATVARAPTANSTPPVPCAATWTNPQNAYSPDDGLDATVTCAASQTACQEWGNFGFDVVIPTDGIITSVVISVEQFAAVPSQQVQQVRAVISGTTQGVHSASLTATRATYTYPATYDRAWTRADLLDAAFKVKVYAVNNDSGASHAHSLGWVKVEVIYETTSAYRLAVLADSPVLYWRLGENVTGPIANVTVANDETANNRDGTYVGSPAHSQVGAVNDSNSSVYFQIAGGQKVFRATEAAFSFERTDSFSLECWARWTDLDYHPFISKENVADPLRGYELYTGTPDGRVYFNMRNAVSPSPLYVEVLTQSGFADGTFHHLVATHDGTGVASGVHIYVDGVDQSLTINQNTLGANTIINTEDIAVGARGGSPLLNAGIDEVAVYNTALTSARVRAHYFAAQSPAPPASLGLGGFMRPKHIYATGDSGNRYGLLLSLYWREVQVRTLTAALTSGLQSLDPAVARTATAFGTAALSHVVPMPATVVANDLLMLAFAWRGTASFANPSGWTAQGFTFDGTLSMQLWVKAAIGDEGGTNVDVLSSTNPVQAVAHLFRVTNQYQDGGFFSDFVAVRNNSGSSTQPNPNVSTPSWLTPTRNLWFAIEASSATEDVTVYPTNYTNGLYTPSDAGGLDAETCSMGSAWRLVEGGSEDPSAFTIANSASWGTATVGVRGVVDRRLLKQVNKPQPATLRFIGAMAKQARRPLSATQLFVGAVSTVFTPGFIQQALFATLSFVGTLPLTTNKALAATLPLGGAVAKFTSTARTATLLFIGSTFKQTRRSLVGVLFLVGAAQLGRLFTATLSLVGAVTKQTTHMMPATLLLVGTVTKQVRRLITGTMQFLAMKPGSYSNYRALVLSDNPLSYWKLDDSTKTGSATDEQGALNITYQFATNSSGVDGFGLNGTSTVSTHLYDFLNVSAMSVEFWAKNISPAAGTVNLIGCGDWYVGKSNTNDIYVQRASTPGITFSGGYILNQWTHCVFTYDGTNMRLYSGGKLRATLASGNNNSAGTGVLFLGAGFETFEVDEAAVYGYALTPEQVAQHADAALTKQTRRTLAGTLAFLGTVLTTKTFVRVIANTLSFIGNTTKQANKALTATLLPVGAVTKQTRRALAATSALAGAVFKQTNRLLTVATLVLNGATATTKTFVRVISNTLSFIGNTTKQTNKALTATLPLVGAVTKQARRTLSATLALVGAVFKQTNRLLTVATLVLNGVTSTTKTFVRVISNTLSFIGNTTKQTNKALSGTLLLGGAIIRQTRAVRSATLALVGATLKQTRRTLTATLAFLGATTTIHNFVLALVATLAFIGTTTKRTQRTLTATAVLTGAVTKRTARTLVGGLAFVGQVLLRIPKSLTATLSSTGTVGRQTRRALAATLRFIGFLDAAQSTFRSQLFLATLSFVGTTTRSRTKVFAATLAFVGRLTRIHGILKGLAEYLSMLRGQFVGLVTFRGATEQEAVLEGTTAVTPILSGKTEYNRV